jgi:hypothetical protein
MNTPNVPLPEPEAPSDGADDREARDVLLSLITEGAAEVDALDRQLEASEEHVRRLHEALASIRDDEALSVHEMRAIARAAIA